MTAIEFSRVSYDGDLEDADREDLESLVGQYEEAQEANAAEFEAAKEQVESLEDVDVSDFHDARSDLIEGVTGYDSFEDSPVGEDDLEDASFGKLREWDAYFAAQDAEAEADDEEADDEEADFDDMGEETPTDEEPDDTEFAKQHLDLGGVNF